MNYSCPLETCPDLHSTIACKSSSFPAQMSSCLSFLSPAVCSSLLPAVIVNKKGTKGKMMFGLKKGYKPLFSHSVKAVSSLQSISCPENAPIRQVNEGKKPPIASLPIVTELLILRKTCFKTKLQ